jgi:hypothetical protein
MKLKRKVVKKAVKKIKISHRFHVPTGRAQFTCPLCNRKSHRLIQAAVTFGAPRCYKCEVKMIYNATEVR